MGRTLNPQSINWKKTKLRIVKRDNEKCVRCKSRQNLTVHHIKPRSEGGVTVARNLITLCNDCHDWAECNDPTWDKLTKMSKDKKPEKKGVWTQTEFGLCFTHDEDCQCGDCFIQQ